MFQVLIGKYLLNGLCVNMSFMLNYAYTTGCNFMFYQIEILFNL